MDNSNNNNNNIETRYICTFLLHALGDTIGFKNGDWEFNYNRPTTLDSVFEFVSEFVEQGGVNGISLKDWMVSDDTLYHMAVAIGLLHYDGKFDEKVVNYVKESLISMYNRMVLEERNENIKRYPGKTTDRTGKTKPERCPT